MSDIYTKFHIDPDRHQIVTERVQDCTPIADITTQLRNEGMHHNPVYGTHVASIPKVMVEKYCNAHGITLREWMCNPEHVQRMIDDPALAAFRVYDKSITL